MQVYPTAATDTQFANLECLFRGIRINPDAGQVGDTSCYNAIFTQCKNDRLFQRSQVAVDIGKEMVQVQNRISNDLTRPVIRNITAQIGRASCRERLCQYV